MLLLIPSPPKIYKEEKTIFKNNIFSKFYLLISLLSHISFCFFSLKNKFIHFSHCQQERKIKQAECSCKNSAFEASTNQHLKLKFHILPVTMTTELWINTDQFWAGSPKFLQFHGIFGVSLTKYGFGTHF